MWTNHRFKVEQTKIKEKSETYRNTFLLLGKKKIDEKCLSERNERVIEETNKNILFNLSYILSSSKQ